MTVKEHTSKSPPLLRVKEVSKDFIGLRALSDINLHLNADEILGIIGPNGSGKSTLLNLITGIYHPTKGEIFFLEHNISHAEPDSIAAMGIGRTFQNIRLFKMMSVLDNVRVAMQLHNSANFVSALCSLPNFLHREKGFKEQAMALLKSFRLDDYYDLPASSLPYGTQRRLEIARALALHPKLLLLDEPTVGMNPTERQEILELIQKIHHQYDLAIILIAHDMNLIMHVCHRIGVLNEGKTIAVGLPDEVRVMPQVIRAYLGGE